MTDTDVIVVGSGTGGLAAARKLRHAGYEVLVLERKSLAKAAHTWLNGCEPDIFEMVFGRPALPHEIHENPKDTILTSPGGHTLTTQKFVYSVRMDAIRQTLLDKCLDLGVRFREQIKVNALTIKDGVVCGVSTDQGDLSSRLVIDASGCESGLRLGLEKAPFTRTLPRTDTCIAYDASFHLDYSKTDPRYQPDTAVSYLSRYGIYSVLKVHVTQNADELSILLGIMADYPQSLSEIMDATLAQTGGAGERIFGGGGKIPLSHHLSSFVHDGYAVVGDAAFQVNAQHGSGTASSLLAGHLAGEAGIRALGEDGVASRDALWSYNVNYMRGRGVVMIQQQIMRLFTCALTMADVDALFREEIVSQADVAASIKATNLDLDLGRTLKKLRGFTMNPHIAVTIGKLAPLVGVLTMMHRAYPGRAWEWDWGGWPAMYDRIMRTARSVPFPEEAAA